MPCGQIDIDAWFAENTEHARTCLRAFLNWAMQSRRCRRSLAIPTMKVSRRAALSEDERLDALGRLLTDTEIPMRLRVAGVIVLLYAQPVSRIVRLSIDDVIHSPAPSAWITSTRSLSRCATRPDGITQPDRITTKQCVRSCRR
ncbi:hypothetical protein ABTX35_03225 [Streptomyces sp. NPDC096080]|uniref:hypothetical protein n=1 Tax=Streptomyces sp. NPDC096080 TaxID=3156693 RepID=UPI00332625C0